MCVIHSQIYLQIAPNDFDVNKETVANSTHTHIEDQEKVGRAKNGLLIDIKENDKENAKNI